MNKKEKIVFIKNNIAAKKIFSYEKSKQQKQNNLKNKNKTA